MKKILNVIGDPIWDVYISQSNQIISSKNTVAGGALNAYFNAESICSSDKNIDCTWTVPVPDEKYKIYRINNKTLNLYTENEKINFYRRHSSNLVLNLMNFDLSKFSSSLLLISDYNKGFVNSSRFISSNQYDFLIVDSKYRSLSDSFLQLGKIKIWRCTGDEYSSNFAKSFDWIINTNGPNSIKIIDQNKNIIYNYNVPTVENEIDSCGAGDTFTAALASKILQENAFNHSTQIPFAIKCAQDVVSKQGTNITNIKL